MNNDERIRRSYQAALSRRSAGTVPPPLEQLEALAAGRLDADTALPLLDLVMSDPQLRAEFELLRATHAAGRTRLSRPIPAWAGLAATVFLVASVGLVWQATRREPAVVRSPGTLLAAPANAATVAAPVTLHWHRARRALRYEVRVMTGTGDPVLTITTTDTAIVVAAGLLQPGATYRWWIDIVSETGGSTRSEVRQFSLGPGPAASSD